MMKNLILFQLFFLHLATHGTQHISKNFISDFYNYSHQAIGNFFYPNTDNPYATTVATVRTGNQLCDQEKSYTSKRLAVIQKSLHELGLGAKQGKVPRIALVCSGGGYRAMLYTTGVLKALENLTLLDTILYLVGLSGSTWAIATWISSNKSINEFHDWLINHINFDLNEFDQTDYMLIERTMARKYWAGQPIGFSDIYGASIASDLFDLFAQEKEKVCLSDQCKMIADGRVPFPIYTAVCGNEGVPENVWFECTPYEVGAPLLDAYVPTWAFGRKFNNGTSVTYDREQSLGNLLGTFGLAVGVSVKYLLEDSSIAQNMKSALFKEIVLKVIKEYGTLRFITADFWNFTANMSDKPFNNKPVLALVDAGLDFNVPYPPISGQRSERTADIIIFIDASSTMDGSALQKAETYARTHNLLFPIIDYTNLTKQAVSIFTDDNPQVPVVIYIPRIIDTDLLESHKNDLPELYEYLKDFDIENCVDDGPCNTFNFFYTAKEARRVTALGEFNILLAQKVIKDAIQGKINCI